MEAGRKERGFLFRMFHGNGRFWRRTFTIALPITVQTLLNNVLNLVDNVMIGRLGETSISAVGLANRYYVVLTMLLFGVVSGASILTSQYWGNRDIPNVKKTLGFSMLVGVTGALLFMVIGMVTPGGVMRIFTPSQGTIALGAKYLSIVVFSYPLLAITNVYTASLRGINMVKIPVVISLIAIASNVILNYLFIFGKLGLPAMGVAGAALATLLARVIECVAIVAVVYGKRTPLAAKRKELFTFDSIFIGKFLKHVLPIIANEFMWGLGTTMYSLVYGRMGDGAVASITICQTAEQVLQAGFVGISSATGVILGNEMGANELDRAERYARYLIVLQFMLSACFMLIAFSLRGIIADLYKISPEVRRSVILCLTVYVCYLPFKMFNMVNIVGILRSGGDTKAAMILDTTGVWFWALPLAILGGLVWKLPIYWVYAMVMSEEFLKAIFSFFRYRQKKWLKNIAI